jgi:hypothetical protein
MESADWGDIVIAVAAVAAAAVAAVTANYRMRRQLEHDRDLRVRDELRGVIDNAAEALADAAEAMGEIFPLGKQAQSGSNFEAFEAAVRTAEEKTHDIARHWQRLILRFGRTHEAPTALWAAREALLEALAQFEEGQVPTDEQIQLSRDLYRESASRTGTFTLICAPLVSV